MSLPGAVRDIINERLRTVWTTSIGRIDRVYRDELRCDVTLMYQKDGIDYSLGKVPVMIQRTGNSAILMSYKPGDLVVVIFNRSPNSSMLFNNRKVETNPINFGIGNALIVCSITTYVENGDNLYGDENLVIPEHGIRIVSDESIRMLAPCVDIPSPILQGSEEGEDATTSSDYIQAWRYNFVTGPWKYIIHVSYATTNSSAGRENDAMVQIDDSITIYENSIKNSSANKWNTFSNIYFLDLTSEGIGPNSHYIDFDFRRPSGGTAKIKSKRVVIYKVIENVGCPIP